MGILIRVYIFIYLLSFAIFASPFRITNIEVDCGKSDCYRFLEVFHFVEGHHKNISLFKKKLIVTLKGSGISQFSYNLIKDSEGGVTFKVKLKEKKNIESLQIDFGKYLLVDDSLTSVLKSRVGKYYSMLSDQIIKKEVSSFFLSRGYKDVFCHIEVTPIQNNSVSILIKAGPKNEVIVKNIITRGEDKSRISDLYKKLSLFVGKIWDKITVQRLIESYIKKYRHLGFFDAQINYNILSKKNSVDLYLDINKGNKYLFDVKSTVLTKRELIAAVRSKFEIGSKVVDSTLIKKVILELLSKDSYLSPQIHIDMYESVDKGKNLVRHFFVKVNAGLPSKLSLVTFQGISSTDQKKLKEIFYDKADDLTSSGKFSFEYLSRFVSAIKEYYYKRGFVMVHVRGPFINIKGNNRFVEYSINVGSSVEVEKINWGNLDRNIVSELSSLLVNKIGRPLDLVAISKDRLKILKYAKQYGYYYAYFDVAELKKIVTYRSAYSFASLNYAVNAGLKFFVKDFIVNGIYKTKHRTLKNIIGDIENKLLTPLLLEEIRSKLLESSLFSKVDVSTYIIEKGPKKGFVNILINVSERKYGSLEVAPGFRSDLGLKLSTALLWSNLWGKNRSLLFSVNGNRRFDLSSLDERRESEEKNLIEFHSNLKYVDPFIFDLPLSWSVEASVQRKRYYSFDADILHFSTGFSKAFLKHFIFSFQYQLDHIEQYDASSLKDKGVYRIGSITPSVDIDFRDNKVTPRKGFVTTISYEVANPSLNSIKDDDFEVNYKRAMFRSRAYFPVNKVTLATSITFGWEKNQSNIGHIPSTRVFRLGGIDNIRGYRDGEQNLLTNGVDIRDTRLTDKAYMFLVKLEPRFSINDNILLGVFLDGGRVTLSKDNLFNLRYGVGVGVKFETPVGSLDFSYGLKIDRNENESFGLFQYSVGYF